MNVTNGKFQILYLAIMIAIAGLFWNTIFIYPIKLFVVMLHEMSHGLMAMLFGGTILQIQIDPRIGGYCQYRLEPSFWSSIMTASAGYLGSLLWGTLILVLAVKTKKDHYISLIIGFVLLWLSYFVLKSGEFFGTAMTVGLGIFMLVAYKYFSPVFHDLWLKFIGITSCFYVILDIKDDLIDRTNIGSDADQIAEITGFSSQLIGIIWILIAITTLFFTLKYIYKHQGE